MSKTLPGLFLESVRRFDRPDAFWRKRAGAWERISARQAARDVACLAAGLQNLGVRSGDRVALLSENRYEWAVADLAVLGLGAVTVPLYPTLTAEQCERLLRDSGAVLGIVSTSDQFAKLRRAAAEIEAVRGLVHMERVEAATRVDRAFEAVREWGSSHPEQALEAYRSSAETIPPESLATIIYTSGTTGEPKGAMLSHANIVFDVEAGLPLVEIGPEDRSLSFLPLSHVFARTADLYGMLSLGVAIAFAESLEAVSADLLEVRPTVLFGVPRFFEKGRARVLEAGRRLSTPRRQLFDWGLRWGHRRARAFLERRPLSPLAAWQAALANRLVGRPIRARFGGRLSICVSGGARLAPEVQEFFYAVGIPLREGYGLTETSPVITLTPASPVKPGSVGPAIPGVEVRIAQNGEICTRGPHVMLGYWNQPTATREAIRDGWFHTGDVGHLDEDGYLFITDRLKELLVTAGGKKVAPQPIEAHLKKSPWVSEAILLGDGRPYVAALLIPEFAELEEEARRRGWDAADRRALLANPEVRAHYDQLVALVNEELARFEQIKRYELLDRELSAERGELTLTLKLRRRVIAEHFAEAIGRLYAGHDSPADAELGG